MHNIFKIRVFRVLLCITYPIALIFIYPFALFKKKNKGNLFFFFDRYAIGGAQRVHLDILEAVEKQYKQLYFTRLSQNQALKDEFFALPNCDVRDIHFWCDNLLFRLFTVHYYSLYINRHRKAHVFSSNSTFFYDILFFLKKKVIKTELLHNFTYGKNGMEFFGLANYKYLDHRILVDFATYNNIANQYQEYNVDKRYMQRVQVIEPGVFVSSAIKKDYSLPLKVLYAGRGTAQKRIYLLNKIAESCIKAAKPIQFHFAGSMMDELSKYVKEHSVIHGEISEPAKMNELYDQCHVILMTSSYEGFPMLIKEGMAHGCVPVVTALEGNKSHLFHSQNALLIDDPANENHVVTKGVELLTVLCNNPFELERLSEAAHNYAKTHFDRNKFIKTYNSFFEEPA